MDFEVADEAFPVLSDVINCRKQDTHDDFKDFVDLDVDDLPVKHRNEQTLKYIQSLGNRVVRLVVEKPAGAIFGSGVVFRVGAVFIILTNDHVVGCEEDVKNCKIEFFYHDVTRNAVVTSRGQKMLGSSNFQDRCFFTFSPVPPAIEDMAMFDNSELVADITYSKDGSSMKCNGYVNMKDDKWLVMAPLPSPDIGEDCFCEVAFTQKGCDEPQLATFVRILSTEDKGHYIEITDVPEFVKSASLASWVAPWPMGCKEFTPMVIHHPHGVYKKVTVGKMLAVESDSVVDKLYHTAKTCPGSSGGLVITVGGDSSKYFAYPAYICIHCQGDRASEFRGVPTETGNVNVSLFNNS
ncbi:hypothetical protein LOTGIDRAFT_171041 [Lottia gigantea]|uniref:Serine protease n=1 Tax=Lottia gigantea TaxID=225164 RepID=V4B1I4_LOTGI|nr:hypothetical protein LOTGIDRAFT_171041 [Lottia gigantea]ESP04203.1 hypothetical protein LOTGIDRAFT_171041 [Lottia gigantea]